VHKGLKTSSLHALRTYTAKFEYLLLLLTYFLKLFALDLSVFSIMQLGDQFAIVEAAQEAVKRYVLDNRESFKVDKSDKKRFLIKCKERGCGFAIRVSKSSKEIVFITIFKLHTCSPAVHYNNRQAHSVSYLIEHHCAAIINNRKITVAQI
jgi:hypothetical protein